MLGSRRPADRRSPIARQVRANLIGRFYSATERNLMEIGLASLIAEGSAPHVDESRAFFAARQAAGGQRGPATYEELRGCRECLCSAITRYSVMLGGAIEVGSGQPKQIRR